jgi:hypothetical protein
VLSPPLLQYNRAKTEGKCGSCWAFSAVGAIEGLTFLEGNHTLLSLSEETLVECDKKGNRGCKGGNMASAMGWVKRHGGLPTEHEYPYTSTKGTGGGVSHPLCRKKEPLWMTETHMTCGHNGEHSRPHHVVI